MATARERECVHIEPERVNWWNRDNESVVAGAGVDRKDGETKARPTVDYQLIVWDECIPRGRRVEVGVLISEGSHEGWLQKVTFGANFANFPRLSATTSKPLRSNFHSLHHVDASVCPGQRCIINFESLWVALGAEQLCDLITIRCPPPQRGALAHRRQRGTQQSGLNQV